MSIEELPVGITPLTFTGVSSFSNDFQTILTRAVSIAQLPITALQNQDSDVLQEKTLAASLQSAVAALATSVTNLGSIGSSQGMAGTSSDTTKVVVNSTTATAPASYAITNISSLASAASASTVSGYADASSTAVSASGTMQLSINGVAVSPNITLDASQNNLDGLANAINGLNAGVTASVISTGTGATPYYLSISANSTGLNAITLVEDPNGTNGGPTPVALNSTPGSNADFYVNGAHVTSPTNEMSTVIPGMDFTLAGTTKITDPAVTLSATSDPTQISTGLQDFVTKYNAVETLLNAQIGPSGGLLSGNSLIYGVQSALRGLVNFNGTGAIKSLSDIGIELDSTGVMSFNQTTTDPSQHIAFDSLSSAQIAGAFSFLGSATTGFGELANSLTQYSDPISGAIQSQQDQFTATDTRLNDQITTMTAQVNSMQTALSAQLQAADSQIAQMQSQQQLLTSTLQGLNFASYGYQGTNPTSFAPSTGTSSSSGG
jgi:flagellar hook-associated protein 2